MNNLGIGIANAVWVAGIIALIMIKDLSMGWLLLPIFFNWKFIEG